MSPKRIRNISIAILGVALAFASTATAAPSNGPQPTWVASWASSLQAADPDPREPLLSIDGQTVRQRVRLSVGGTQIQVRLSNEHGSTPLVIGSATVALPTDPSTVKAESLRQLTFGGRSQVTIPAGAPVLSDPVDLSVASGAEISVSLYFPQRVSTPTLHGLGLKRAVVTSRGDFTRADRVEARAVSQSSILLSAVLVPARPRQRLIVAFGDSLTDGDGSTVDADRNWPNALARRFRASADDAEVAVVNAGIAGNRLLADGFGIKALGIGALARFDRDALSLPGITHVVLLEGINDIGSPGATLGDQPLAGPGETPTVEDLIGAYRQLVARANARGVKVIGATLTPFEGVDLAGYYTGSKEVARQAVNHWIRTSGVFEAVIDFDAVLRDPNHPSRIQARYDSSDHIHPNDAGYQAMADAIDLRVFSETERVFELNIYHAVPGKVSALESRFRDAAKLQAKHDLDVIGYWVPDGDPAWNNTFIYMVEHATRDEADRHWHEFHADPEFKKYVQAEEAEPLIESVDTVYMHPTDYSRMR